MSGRLGWRPTRDCPPPVEARSLMTQRLRRTRDVRAVLASGWAAHGQHAVGRGASRDDAGPCRWTVSASRRVGAAVQRNRAKRRLRAVAREQELPRGMDVVIIARASAVTCGFAELAQDVGSLMDQVAARAHREVTS